MRTHERPAFLLTKQPSGVRGVLSRRISDATEGLATSNAVFTSKLAMEGRVVSVESRLQIGSTVFVPLPIFLKGIRYQGLHVLRVDTYFRLLRAILPLHWLFFSSCSSSTRTVVYHLETVLRKGIARNPRSPFFEAWRMASAGTRSEESSTPREPDTHP